MPKLSLAVRLAAASILILSLAHIAAWGILAFYVFASGLNDGQFTMLFVALSLISAGGFAGVLVAIGIFKAKNWARTAALALAALVACICAFSLLIVCILILEGPNIFSSLIEGYTSSIYGVALLYFLVLCIAVWWIVLFSRPKIAAQFEPDLAGASAAHPRKPTCPPPIALLGWLMILSAILSALCGLFVNGTIPAMLFNRIFAGHASQGIWTVNIAILLFCGIGLLRLQRWSYEATIAFHAFWLVSVFVSQLSPSYETYWRLCLNTLNIADTYPFLTRTHFSPWISAISTAIPTALLIAGLFYYRRAFLQAVAESRHLSS